MTPYRTVTQLMNILQISRSKVYDIIRDMQISERYSCLDILISDKITRVNLCAVLDYFMYISAKSRGIKPAPYDARKMAELTAPIILVENWKLIQKAREEGINIEKDGQFFQEKQQVESVSEGTNRGCDSVFHCGRANDINTDVSENKRTILGGKNIMRAREEEVVNRMLSMKEAQAYLNLSRNTARLFCEKANAIVHIGGRVLVDRFALDDALDKMREGNVEL